MVQPRTCTQCAMNSLRKRSNCVIIYGLLSIFEIEQTLWTDDECCLARQMSSEAFCSAGTSARIYLHSAIALVLLLISAEVCKSDLPEIKMFANASNLIVMIGNQHRASVRTMKKNRIANPVSFEVAVALFRVFCNEIRCSSHELRRELSGFVLNECSSCVGFVSAAHAHSRLCVCVCVCVCVC